MTLRALAAIFMIGSLLKLFGCSREDKRGTMPTEDEIQKSIESFKNQPIYKSLTPEIISKIKDDELELAIFENISINMGGNEREQRDIVMALTPGQRAIYVTWIVESEVNNGGFTQFYFNSSGELADMGEEAFNTIGAIEFAELMKQANETYVRIKDDLEKYNDRTTESFSKSYENNPLNDMDDKFYKLYTEEPLAEMRIKFIRDNVNQFIAR
jgi:hypothetical protein